MNVRFGLIAILLVLAPGAAFAECQDIDCPRPSNGGRVSLGVPFDKPQEEGSTNAIEQPSGGVEVGKEQTNSPKPDSSGDASPNTPTR